MSFAYNIPFFSIFLAMIAGITTGLIQKGRLALRVTEGLCMVVGAMSAYLLYDLLKTGESFTFMMGHFPAPWGNELRAGVFEASIALLFCLVMLLSLEGGRRDLFSDLPEEKQSFYCLFLNLLLASLLALVYTNDLFTGYVFIEINALTACAIVVAKDKGLCLLATIRYMVMSSVGSGLFLIGVVLLYNITGHLLMPGLDEAVAALAASGQYNAALTVSMMLLVLGLAIKSALFPFHGWLPDAYASATTSASAIQAGLISKGYIVLLLKLIYRVFTLDLMVSLHMTDVLFVFGIAGMLYGSVRAMQEKTAKRMVGYSSVAQMAYIFMGIGLGSEVGIAAVCYQIFAHSMTKPMLFTAVGALIRDRGGNDSWHNLRGSARENRLAGVAFAIGGLALCGIPILAGFAAKYQLGAAALVSPQRMLIALLALGASSVLSTLYYIPAIIAIWAKPESGVAEETDVSPHVREESMDPHFVVSTAVFLCGNVALGVCFGPVMELIETGLSML